MNKSAKIQAAKARAAHNAQGFPQRYTCALCPGEITVSDSVNGDLISVNIDGHAKAAHRVCPTPETVTPVDATDEDPTDGD